ncbi:MAG: tetratricopeptide repeat protein [Betaproteobacteria bacterium]|nr:tetratricopeptide repeat protein [Betaproteobacteria bacterium]
MIPLMPLHIRKLFSWILCLSFALGMLSGCGKSDGGDYLASGSKRAADGDYIAALIDFRNAVARDPQSAEARFKLGSTMRLLGDYPGAGIELKKAEELGYDRDAVILEQLMLHLNAGQFAEVLNEGSARALSSPDARASQAAIKGEALIATTNDAEARLSYDEALKQAPDNGLATLGMVRLALISGDTRTATERIDFSCRKIRALTGLGISRECSWPRKAQQKAAVAFESAVKVRPGDLAARFALVQARISMADFDGAFQEVSQLKKHYPNAPMSSYAEALVAYRKGNKGHALDAIRQALKLAPEDQGVLMLAGILELERGNFASAESLLRKVVSASPDDAQVGGSGRRTARARTVQASARSTATTDERR